MDLFQVMIIGHLLCCFLHPKASIWAGVIQEKSLFRKNNSNSRGTHVHINRGENTPSRYSIEIKIAFFYHAVHSKGIMDVREKSHF